MSFFDWLSIALICLIGAASPGPSLLIITYQATSFSIKSALAKLEHNDTLRIKHSGAVQVYSD